MNIIELQMELNEYSLPFLFNFYLDPTMIQLMDMKVLPLDSPVLVSVKLELVELKKLWLISNNNNDT